MLNLFNNLFSKSALAESLELCQMAGIGHADARRMYESGVRFITIKHKGIPGGIRAQIYSAGHQGILMQVAHRQNFRRARRFA